MEPHFLCGYKGAGLSLELRPVASPLRFHPQGHRERELSFDSSSSLNLENNNQSAVGWELPCVHPPRPTSKLNAD